MVDSLVNLVNGFLEPVAGQGIISPKFVLEIQKFLLKPGDIQVLVPHCLQFSLVLQGIHGGIAQNRDDLDEKLRADHIHLRILMGHIHDTRIIVVTVRLQKRYQYCVLAALLPAVLVQLFEEIRILMLGGGSLVFVLHLKHDGDVLQAILIIIPENVIALASAFGYLVVLLKIGILEANGPHLIEGDLAVLLQRFPNHFGRLLRF